MCAAFDLGLGVIKAQGDRSKSNPDKMAGWTERRASSAIGAAKTTLNRALSPANTQDDRQSWRVPGEMAARDWARAAVACASDERCEPTPTRTSKLEAQSPEPGASSLDRRTQTGADRRAGDLNFGVAVVRMRSRSRRRLKLEATSS